MCINVRNWWKCTHQWKITWIPTGQPQREVSGCQTKVPENSVFSCEHKCTCIMKKNHEIHIHANLIHNIFVIFFIAFKFRYIKVINPSTLH